MIYPKTPFCPLNNDNMDKNSGNGNARNNMGDNSNMNPNNRNGNGSMDGSNNSEDRNMNRNIEDRDMERNRNADGRNADRNNNNYNGNNGRRNNSDTDRDMYRDTNNGGRNTGGGNSQRSPEENMNNRTDNMSRTELMNKIKELDFAVVDLNLFLDTHPYDEDALKMLTMLSSALKSYKYDYAKKYGPLLVTDATNNTPFDWVAPENKWPWHN